MNNIKPQTSIYCTYKLKFHCGRGGAQTLSEEDIACPHLNR